MTIIPTSIDLGKYTKAIVAVLGAIATIVTVLVGVARDGTVTLDEAFIVLEVVGTATGVYAFANKRDEDEGDNA